MELILASNSPRRKEILKKFGYEFTVIGSPFEEVVKNDDPYETVRLNAEGKAKSVYLKLSDIKGKVVLGADTIVVYSGKIIGKPKDKDDAVKTLKMLSGKTHEVITGYAVLTEKGLKSGVSVSKVQFNILSENLIYDYVESGLPLDKAGSYGIQDGYDLIKNYSGSLYNIIGLPIEDLIPIFDSLK